MLKARRRRLFRLKNGANPLAQDLRYVTAIKQVLGAQASVASTSIRAGMNPRHLFVLRP